jgi:hypothetical protein
MALLDPPSRFAEAEDLEPPPQDSRNVCAWVRDQDNGVWLRKTIDPERLLGEAVAVEFADSFGVTLADGAADVATGSWFSWRLDLLSWDAVLGPGVNKSELARLILFDLALGIPDRHAGNVLLSPFEGQYWPIGIDHELAVVAYQGSMAVPIQHSLPGAPLTDPALLEELRMGGVRLARGPNLDIRGLKRIFPDADVDGLQRAVWARCRALPDLVERWIGLHQEISS